MRVFNEEIFEPVASIYKFQTENEVMVHANAPLWIGRIFLFSWYWGIWRVYERLEYGMVEVNVGSVFNEVAPFGGIKESRAWRL